MATVLIIGNDVLKSIKCDNCKSIIEYNTFREVKKGLGDTYANVQCPVCGNSIKIEDPKVINLA